MIKGTGKKSKRPAIGFLINGFDTKFQLLLWSGIEEAAKKFDVNIICFNGGEIISPETTMNGRNCIYNLISPETTDGLILASSTLLSFIGTEGLTTFCRRFKTIPMASMGIQLKGIPSVVTDNRIGLSRLVNHLIKDHGYRRILYIGGQPQNYEAEQRFSVYKEVLKNNNIEIDPDLVTVGDFGSDNAYYKVTDLIRKKLNFEAVVCANDTMAYGAIHALLENGKNIPKDVAITGFDDAPSFRFSFLPLSTVHQPIYEMCSLSMEMILKQIHGEEVKELEILKTEAVIRRSCGCYAIDTAGAGSIRVKPGLHEKLADLTKLIILELKRIFRGDFYKIEYGYYEKLIDFFFRELLDDEEGIFLAEYDKVIRKSTLENIDLSILDILLSVIWNSSLPFLSGDKDKLIKAENLLHKAGVLHKETAQQHYILQQLKDSQKNRFVQLVINDLISSYDLMILLDRMANGFPKLDIKSCYLFLHSSLKKLFNDERLIFGYNQNGRIRITQGNNIFRLKSIFSRRLIRQNSRHSMIAEAIYFKDEQIGFIILEMDPNDGVISVSFTNQIRNALKSSLMMQDILEKDKELEKALDELRDNHIQLEQAYFELQENQDKLLISEKMASLGRLTAGIAHEMNTPLAAVRNSLIELNRLIDEYKQSIGNPGVTAEDHYEIANDMLKAVEIAEKTAERAAGFIRGIKAQTRDINDKENRVFNVPKLIESTLLLLDFAIKQGNSKVVFTCTSNSIELFGLPGKFSQVIVNLVTNAIDAMSDKKGGIIKINLSEHDKFIILEIKDQGCGIRDSNMAKIFDPMFTTKPFGQGTGLGLTIVHDIVYGEFHGNIQVKSQVNIGTAFVITFDRDKLIKND